MRHLSRVLGAAALSVTVAAGGAMAEGDTIVEANVKQVSAGDAVPVAKIPSGVYLRTVNDPDDTIWERLPEYRIRLEPAPPLHPSVELRMKEGDEGKDVYVTLARTEDRFYLRMRWRDDTIDVKTLSNRFRDGAAVQFSLGDDETSYLMGDGPDAPVNIWYWRSDRGDVQSLAAGGPGSTTTLDDQPVTGASAYIRRSAEAGGQWVVVMSREISAKGKYQVSLDRGEVPMAFALWQGSEGQRDGWKIVSDGWIMAKMGTE